jgi:hypothetical protein
LEVAMSHPMTTESVHLELAGAVLDGDLHVPAGAAGLVVFAHGSGSSRFSRRNRAVAKVLEHAGFGTFLLDLLTAQEEADDERTAAYRFDIPRLGERVTAVVELIGSSFLAILFETHAVVADTPGLRPGRDLPGTLDHFALRLRLRPA